MVLSQATQSHTHQSITQHIIKAIDAGAGEFVMPWHGVRSRPTNVTSGKRYGGGNTVCLWAESMLRGYTSPLWGTYCQWLILGAQVRKGERGAPIIFYKSVADEREDAKERPEGRLIVRHSTVFNAEQVDGWNEELPLAPPAQIDELPGIDAFVMRTGAEIRHGGDSACYDRRADRIELPDRIRFVGSPTSSATEAYYSTLLHELVHWTGAPHRLNRRFGERFGDAAYAAEELVAEVGAAFLCCDLGVSNEPRADHAAYVASWLRILKADPRAIFTAASLSSAAAAWLSDRRRRRPSDDYRSD